MSYTGPKVPLSKCRRKNIPNDVFVTKYMESIHNRENVIAFAKTLGVSVAMIYSRTKDLRNAGVALPKRPRVKPTSADVVHLNGLITNFTS